MKTEELRKELRTATIGLNKGWRLLRRAKELDPGEYAFIRNDHHCRGWRIILDPADKRVALQQYDPGIDTRECSCTIKDEFGFHVPNPNCPECGGSWELPIDYRTYAPTNYGDKKQRAEFNAVLRDLYFYGIHPLMRVFEK